MVYIACGMIIPALMIVYLLNDTPERFVRRCMPKWEAAFATLADLEEKRAYRGREMPKALSDIFRIDRELKSISMAGDETVYFVFDWSYRSPETDEYIFFQKSDDWWKNVDVTVALSQREKYGEPIKTEETENGLSVTGNGIAGRGYIRITRISPCWFMAEAYWPT